MTRDIPTVVLLLISIRCSPLPTMSLFGNLADVIAEVIVRDGTEGLYRFTSVDLPTIGRVTHCETFVVMRSSKKWMLPPSGLKEW